MACVGAKTVVKHRFRRKIYDFARIFFFTTGKIVDFATPSQCRIPSTLDISSMSICVLLPAFVIQRNYYVKIGIISEYR